MCASVCVCVRGNPASCSCAFELGLELAAAAKNKKIKEKCIHFTPTDGPLMPFPFTTYLQPGSGSAEAGANEACALHETFRQLQFNYIGRQGEKDILAGHATQPRSWRLLLTLGHLEFGSRVNSSTADQGSDSWQIANGHPHQLSAAKRGFPIMRK